MRLAVRRVVHYQMLFLNLCHGFLSVSSNQNYHSPLTVLINRVFLMIALRPIAMFFVHTVCKLRDQHFQKHVTNNLMPTIMANVNNN